MLSCASAAVVVNETQDQKTISVQDLMDPNSGSYYPDKLVMLCPSLLRSLLLALQFTKTRNEGMIIILFILLYLDFRSRSSTSTTTVV